MNVVTLTRRWPGILIGVLLIAAVLTACSDSPKPEEDTATISGDSGAWEEYEAVCSEAAQEELDDNEDYTNGEASTLYAGVIERMESVDPPVEIADWHDKVLAGLTAVKRLIDAEPQDAKSDPLILIRDNEILSLFEEVGAARDAMPADVRERLAAAGCSDDADSEPTGEGEADMSQPDSGRTSTGQAFLPTCEPGARDEAALVAFYNATDGPNWRNNTNWLTDAPLDDWAGVSAITTTENGRVVGECVYSLLLADNRLSGEIPAELGKIPTLNLLDNQLSGRILRPNGTNPQYAWEGSTIRVTWDAVDGADYYKVYYDDFIFAGCSLGTDGSPSFCEELAADVRGTTYVHADPYSGNNNYYWVVACNSGGCSEIDEYNPAHLIGSDSVEAGPGADSSTATPTPIPPSTPTPAPVDTTPSAPTNVRYALEGSAIRVSWDPVAGADHYNIYHDDFFDSGCRLNRDGSTSLCEELATNVVGTTYVHAAPDERQNYYWVVACNSGGCSEIDSEHPAAPIEPIPTVPANVRFSVEGSTIRVSWDPVAGADHYNIYHDDFFDSGCRLNRDGSTSLCEELATNVVGTTYVHAAPDERQNYYWVAACNSGGCSEIDSEHPAAPIEPIPTVPANVRFSVEGSTIRVSWDPVAGADHYNIYHDDFFDSGCRLNRDGSTSLCEELASNVVGTTYVHAAPDERQNYYWVVACNSGGCSEIDSTDPAEPLATSTTGSSVTPPTASLDLAFPEGESATRSILENTPAGINVGAPVSAEGDGTLTYTMSGPDAASFTIVPTTGQVRTRDGVVYDYETKNRYTVTVGADDESGESDTIDVTIHIEDLVAACLPVRNLRTNHGDGYLTIRWTPAPQLEGKARVLGYQTEIRRGDSGSWTDGRTFLGRNIGAMVYSALDNGVGYQIRVRPISSEGDCRWSPPFGGIPAEFPTPRYPTDRFGTDPVGAPDRNWRFLTQERCRYTADGVALDADCRYENTGPDTSRIVLEFDDPSRGSCDIRLAFSSLTAGSFVEDCFDAGVNTETPFDTSFRMPRSGPQTESDIEVPRAPRSREEFDVLAWGRDDFIPGLFFGCPPNVSDCGFNLGKALLVERDHPSGVPHWTTGNYTYENTGPSQGVLTFRTDLGDSYVFTLDFEPSGNMRVTITDEEGEPSAWPGMPHLDLALGGQPILLPIPPSWSAAIAIETDFAPKDWNSLESRIPTPRNPAHPESPRDNLLERTLLGRIAETAFGERQLSYSFGYDKVGRNRAVVTIDFRSWCEQHPELCEDLKGAQEDLATSTWSFDLTFTSDGTAQYTLTTTKEGHVPLVREGFVDFNGNSINLNEFPEEVLPPIAPPQASGTDVSGVEIAAAVSASQISGADVQTLLISDQGLQQASYSPGDWLEPKDGSNQRMMIVGASQGASAASTASRQPVQAMTLRYAPAFPSPVVAEPAVFHGMSTFQPVRFAPFTTSVFYSPLVVSASYALASESTIIQLSVVCMQKDYGIPTRGARFFSQPKTAEGLVQTCQRNCVLNETSNIQECVWKCEEN